MTRVYLQSEYDEQGGIAGNITRIRRYVMTGAVDKNTWDTWGIYLVHTQKDYFSSASDWINLASNTLVYDGIISPSDGQWMVIVLTTPFAYNGVDNLVVNVVEIRVTTQLGATVLPSAVILVQTPDYGTLYPNPVGKNQPLTVRFVVQ